MVALPARKRNHGSFGDGLRKLRRVEFSCGAEGGGDEPLPIQAGVFMDHHRLTDSGLWGCCHSLTGVDAGENHIGLTVPWRHERCRNVVDSHPSSLRRWKRLEERSKLSGVFRPQPIVLGCVLTIETAQGGDSGLRCRRGWRWRAATTSEDAHQHHRT